LYYNAATKRLVVADTRNRRLVLYGETEGVLNVDREIKIDKSMAAPIHFVQTEDNRFVVSDPAERRIMILYPSGAVAGPIDLSKVPNGDSIMPGALALDRADKLYLVDETNRRIIIFDEKRRFLRTVKPDDSGLRGLNDVAVDAKSNIFVLDTVGGRVYQLSPDGKPQIAFGRRGPGKEQFDFPVALAVDRRGFVYVLDQHRGTIFVFKNDGSYQATIAARGWDEGKLLYPSAIIIDDADRIYIADRNNHRVQVFVPKKKK
jgi:DNA-binding beta-propeller fold protein YncE